jgi:hypothetical protein
MDSIIGFIESLKLPTCPSGLSVCLQSLWHDGKGDWHAAHDLINDLSGADVAWVHAYLHRKEGDIGNADYWYRRAAKTRPSYSLEREWQELVANFV